MAYIESDTRLGGKVAVSSVAQRFGDERGEVAIVHGSGQPVGFIEVLEFRAQGDARGGHLHAAYTERLYVIEGCLDAQFVDGSEPPGSFARLRLAPGQLVTIAPSVGHRFVAVEPTRALAFGHGSSPLEDRVAVDPALWRAVEAAPSA